LFQFGTPIYLYMINSIDLQPYDSKMYPSSFQNTVVLLRKYDSNAWYRPLYLSPPQAPDHTSSFQGDQFSWKIICVDRSNGLIVCFY
jgi:hypothetical protein